MYDLLEIQSELDDVKQILPDGLYLQLCDVIKKQYEQEQMDIRSRLVARSSSMWERFKDFIRSPCSIYIHSTVGGIITIILLISANKFMFGKIIEIASRNKADSYASEGVPKLGHQT